MKTLIILRGLPGAGKTRLAETLGFPHFEADQFFYDNLGHYNFDVSKLGWAHEDCITRVEIAMQRGENNLIVSNTSTTNRELKPYMELADKYGYTVFSLIVENRHGGVNSHNVPGESLNRMRERLLNNIVL